MPPASTSSPSGSSSSDPATARTARPPSPHRKCSPQVARRAEARPPEPWGPAAVPPGRGPRAPQRMTALTTDTTAPAASRHETASRFLAALAGDSPGDALLELRYRLGDGRMGQLFDSPRRLRALATRAIFLGRRTDVYVGCAPRTRRHGGRDAVAQAFVIWADCDGDAAFRAPSASSRGRRS